MNIVKSIGQHDTGLFDLPNNIKPTKTLATNVSAAEAVRLTQENKGAELLIEKKGADGTHTYDVFALEVEGKEGKSLKFVDIMDNVDFKPNLAKKLGGDRAILACDNEKWDTPEEDYISYQNIRENLGQGWDSMKYTAIATTYNLLSLASGGKGVGPFTLGQTYQNENLRWESTMPSKPAVPSPAATAPAPPAPPRKTE